MNEWMNKKESKIMKKYVNDWMDEGIKYILLITSKLTLMWKY